MPLRLRRSAVSDRLRRLLAPILVALAVACQRGGPPGAPLDDVARVVLTPQTVRLDADDSLDFTAIAYTAAGDIATATVTWFATAGDVVDRGGESGHHVGRFRAGRACGDQQIIATARPGGAADSATATVVCASVVTAVAVTPPAPTLLVGGLLGLTATALDSAGGALLGLAVAWASDAPSVAVVNGAGVVLGVAPGTARITATIAGTSGEAVVTVTAVPLGTAAVWQGSTAPAQAPGAAGDDNSDLGGGRWGSAIAAAR